MVTTQLLGRDYFVAGDEIGEFTLLEIIGGGGEGGVWSAWDKINERIVALKFFQLDDTTRSLNKRREELLGLAEIEHPYIRTVYSTGDGPGFLYFAMAYYPSGSLADLVRGTPLPPGKSLKTAAQITRALDYIHSQKVIHRDLKPTNILIDHKMHAFLTDFGIARTLSDSTMALHTGQGTPAYSSPEQNTKSFIDNKTDIYSFGVMLFEMFTGDPPWQGIASLAIRQLEDNTEIPDPREMNPELPAGLHDVLKKLTAREPEKRPDTVTEAFQLVLDVWDPTELGEEWQGITHLTLEHVLGHLAPFGLPEEDAKKEAETLLTRTMNAWRQLEGKFRMGLTDFLYLDRIYRHSRSLVKLSKGQISFLAMFSIVHGRNTSFWWDKVSGPKMKLAIAENILEQEVGTPVVNMLDLVLLDPGQFSGVSGASEKLIDHLLEQVNDLSAPNVVQKALALLGILTDESEQWRPVVFSAEKDKQLAEMAISEEIFAVDAAELIGTIRSRGAVEVILVAIAEEETEPRLHALNVIRQRARGWPAGVSFGLRFLTWVQIFQEQVLTDWSAMGRKFLSISLGAALAFLFHVFVTTRLPSYMIASRMLNSVGSGLLFGPIVGAGILLARWVGKRLTVMSRFGRAAAGIIAGGLFVTVGFMLFHILFLSSPPKGFLLLLGSMIIPIGFGLGEAFSLNRAWKAVIATVFSFVGLLIPFIFASRLAVSPMLYYESGEPVKSVLLMFGFSLILGVVPYLFGEPKQREYL